MESCAGGAAAQRKQRCVANLQCVQYTPSVLSVIGSKAMFGESTDAAEGGVLLQDEAQDQALREGDAREGAVPAEQLGAGEGREDLTEGLRQRPGARRDSNDGDGDGDGEGAGEGGPTAEQAGQAEEQRGHQQ